MALVTSAGAGSGIDMESIISASVSAKRTQLEQSVTKSKTLTQTTLSGIGQLKSAISTYTTSLDALSASGAFNKRTTTLSQNITQDATDPAFSVTTGTTASNGEYNVTVKQLAAGSRYEGVFSSSTTPLATADDTLTFTAGSDTFSVDVYQNDTLQTIRKRINDSTGNFGLSANIINSNGQAKLVLNSSVTGAGNDLTITSNTDGAGALATANLTNVTKAQSSIVDIDGNTVTSATNTLTDAVEGLTIKALRVSDSDTSSTATSGALLSNKLTVSTDKSAIKTLITNFVNGYNSLVSSASVLGKRDTITGGVNQNDGGLLAGDSTTRTIQSYMFNLLSGSSSSSSSSSAIKSVFQLGVSMDNTGTLSLDSDKLSTVLDTNYEQVMNLFGGDSGLAAKMSSGLKAYTKTGGFLSQRTDSLNTDLRSLTQKQADIDDQMTKYEASLRTQYGNLDSLIVNMNNSASYLTALSTTTSS
jgi:flagellar hook-associated protein 2